jgi:hypothetical protein
VEGGCLPGGKLARAQLGFHNAVRCFAICPPLTRFGNAIKVRQRRRPQHASPVLHLSLQVSGTSLVDQHAELSRCGSPSKKKYGR